MAISNSDRRTRLDEAIDGAVRDMMRREPPPGFAGRLARRLDVPTRRPLGPVPAWGLASVALLVVAFATFALTRDWHRPSSTPAQPPAMVSRPDAVLPAPARTADVRPPAAVRTAPSAARRQPNADIRSAEAIFGPRQSTVTAANTGHANANTTRKPADAWSWMAVPPLAPLLDIVVPPIAISEIGGPPKSGPR